eukprot:TRINITY_DN729_c0_g1_i2.p1 TRINITY_DN729_c0_g1~~TRINITY_DN729_c0_g1_i2.p1  ORF type:complete len:269 (-),score=37.46 TRINITY_DN729_c0_g1_i2:8-814(-)
MSFFGASMSFFSISFLFLLISLISTLATKSLFQNFRAWNELPVLLSWSKGSYTESEWNQYLIDEYGARGRSAILYDVGKLVTYGATWVFSFLLIFALALLNTDKDSITTAIIVCSAIATVVTLFVIAIPPIFFYLKKRRAQRGPVDFKVNSHGFYWNKDFVSWAPEFVFCCTQPNIVEDVRLNRYTGSQLPCLEFCISSLHRGNKVYVFHRIPVPCNFMNNCIAYIEDNWPNSSGSEACWIQQTDYALALETSRLNNIAYGPYEVELH